MKTKLILFISLLLLFPNYNANATVKPGSTCTKFKSTKIINSIKYTCVKSGKKLIWDKGIVVKYTTGTISSMLNVSESILNLDNIKAGEQCSSEYREQTKTTPRGILICRHDQISAFRWFDAEISKPTENSIIPIAPTITPKTKTYYEIGYENLKDRLSSKTNKSVINWYISDNANARNHQKYIDSLMYSAKLWSEYMHVSQVSVILFTETDSEWIDSKQKELMGQYLINPTEQLQSYRLKQFGCNIGGFYLPNIIVACVKNDTDPSAFFSASMLLAHEYVHVMGMTSMLLTNAPLGDRSRLKPCWFEEGLATYYGFFAAYMLDPNFTKDRINFLTNISTTFNGASKEYIIQTFRDTESNMGLCSKVQDAYALGAVGFERLVFLYGHDKIYYFNQLFYTETDWKQAFYKAFGLTTEQFYDTISNDVISNVWNS